MPSTSVTAVLLTAVTALAVVMVLQARRLARGLLSTVEDEYRPDELERARADALSRLRDRARDAGDADPAGVASVAAAITRVEALEPQASAYRAMWERRVEWLRRWPMLGGVWIGVSGVVIVAGLVLSLGPPGWDAGWLLVVAGVVSLAVYAVVGQRFLSDRLTGVYHSLAEEIAQAARLRPAG